MTTMIFSPGRHLVANMTFKGRRRIDRFLARIAAGICEDKRFDHRDSGTLDEIVCGVCLPCKVRLLVTRGGLAKELDDRILLAYDQREAGRDRRRREVPIRVNRRRKRIDRRAGPADRRTRTALSPSVKRAVLSQTPREVA